MLNGIKIIADDPVLHSNVARTLSFATAGPNTRTTQLFINYQDNGSLDSQGFSPVGIVVSGWASATAIFNPTPGDSNGVDQGSYTQQGSVWIKQAYPGINFITSAAIDLQCKV